MKAIRIHEHGATDVLCVDQILRPEPKANEVLVEIKAAAMNHLDIWVRKGIPGVPLPVIMGSDGAGIVQKTGREVSDYSVGDEVIIQPLTYCGTCTFCQSGRENYCTSWGILGENQDGVQAEWVVLTPRNLRHKPKHLSWEEAASFALAGQTAYMMLIRRARLQSGEVVLIWGATSGVGSLAIQIAKAQGSEVLAVAGTAEKCNRATSLDADLIINYREQSVSEEVKQFTKGRGVDVVFDHVGTASWKTSLSSLAKGGRLVTCGATTGSRVELDLRHLFYKQQTIMGSTMGDGTSMDGILKLVADGIVKPVVDRSFTFGNIRQAHEYLENDRHRGKVIILP
ncbi:MAG: zinc-binding dehydrogenase [FCB group bacterium]|nr:zinc-binding dehydrogenase [FCB group bacterium]